MIFRAPTWLRWLIDFELVFGEDLDPRVKAKKLYPYYKQLKAEEIRAKERVRERIAQRDAEELVKKEIENIIARMQREYTKFPFDDKYRSYVKHIKGERASCVDYQFENGDTVSFVVRDAYRFDVIFNSRLGKNTSVTSTGKNLYLAARAILITITNNSVKRTAKGTKNTKSTKSSTTKDPATQPDIDPNVKRRYNLIVKQIKLKQTELNRIDDKSPNYSPLLNELNTYKKMADKMKKQFA